MKLLSIFSKKKKKTHWCYVSSCCGALFARSSTPGYEGYSCSECGGFIPEEEWN